MTNSQKIITEHKSWETFLQYKISGGHLSKREEEALTRFVEEKRYLPLALAFAEKRAELSAPQLKTINKHNNQKKRSVFIFPEDQNFFLKFISFLLLEYDGVFPENLCSFRKNMTVKTAIRKLTKTKGISKKFV